MKFIYFASLDDDVYHEVTKDIIYKNFFDFILSQWGEEMLTDEINKFIDGDSEEKVQSYTFDDFLYSFCVGIPDYCAIDENDNELADVEDSTVTFQKYIKEHCHIDDSDLILSIGRQSINQLFTSAFKMTIQKKFSDRLIERSILTGLDVCCLTFDSGTKPIKYMITNCTVSAALQNSPTFIPQPQSKELEKYKKDLDESCSYLLGSVLNDITVFVDPLMAANDCRILLTSEDLDEKNSVVINMDPQELEQIVNS